MTTRLMPLLLVATLGLSGCAKSDWIDRTLVTADVTGTWVGSIGVGNNSGEIQLELEQQGPKVNGRLRKLGAGWGFHQSLGGPLERAVQGDVFTFTLTSGNAAQGQATVNGDEMKGYLAVSGTQPLYLRRTSSSSPSPTSQP
jgi:hypothetical protein